MSGGEGELTVKNGLDLDAVAVLSDITRPNEALVSVYIQSEDSYTITGIHDGIYILYYSIGLDWDSNSQNFSTPPMNSRFEKELAFETTNSAATVYTATLNKIYGGNAKTIPVDESKFPR